MLSLNLPKEDRSLENYRIDDSKRFVSKKMDFSRTVFAAAHVVCDPFNNKLIDFDTTLAFRENLWQQGLGDAEAMDTAQRGMGLDWSSSKELIKMSLQAANSGGKLIACGAGTDQLDNNKVYTIDDVIKAYEEQCGFIEKYNGKIILMASRILASIAEGPELYYRVYNLSLIHI